VIVLHFAASLTELGFIIIKCTEQREINGVKIKNMKEREQDATFRSSAFLGSWRR